MSHWRGHPLGITTPVPLKDVRSLQLPMTIVFLENGGLGCHTMAAVVKLLGLVQLPAACSEAPHLELLADFPNDMG